AIQVCGVVHRARVFVVLVRRVAELVQLGQLRREGAELIGDGRGAGRDALPGHLVAHEVQRGSVDRRRIAIARRVVVGGAGNRCGPEVDVRGARRLRVVVRARVLLHDRTAGRVEVQCGTRRGVDPYFAGIEDGVGVARHYVIERRRHTGLVVD